MKKLIKHAAVCTMSLLCLANPAEAQRQTIPLGRAVVAAQRNNAVTITWRRLAQEPENATYNIYVDRNGGGNFTLLNKKPVSLNNYSTTLSAVPYGSSIAVSIIDSNGKENEKSAPFIFKNHGWANAAVRVNFEAAGSPIKSSADFSPKFAWPVDLNGDGEMEYVVNRLYGAKNPNGYEGHGDDALGGDYLEAYTRDGKHLWTVNLGVNFFSFGGQNDGVTVGDFDGDGKGEVIVQVCEGARLWDSKNRRMGKYLYYNGTQQSADGKSTVTVSSDGSYPDIDGDGMVNYTYYSAGKNPQHYMLVIDGMTGEQKDVCAMTMPKDHDAEYTRTNKAAFMADEYPYLSPEMGSAFLDGIHQSAVAQLQMRTKDGNHHYFTYAYGYEGGDKLHELWCFKFHENGTPSEFHHIRIGDIDGDGRDEVMNGACAVDHDGTLLWDAKIAHGDRFRLSDIDPDTPGQEIFAIQQDAPDMLGQLIYSAVDGKSLKRWYMQSVGDVGRGECMDVDPQHKGYEMWSTLPNMYAANGETIIAGEPKSAGLPYPFEGVWWDGNLARECAWENGSTDHNLVIGGWSRTSGTWSRMIEMSKESEWMTHGESGGRAMFWGDIMGDWREEVMLKTNDADKNYDGFVIYTTDHTSDINNIYCLLEDPNYFGQITNRGYYQSPMTGFYLGYDMPRPPLPPLMREDATTKVYGMTHGEDINNLTDNATRNIYCMPVKGQTMRMTAAINNPQATLWKGMQGTLAVNTDINTRSTIVSEGTINLGKDAHLHGNTELRARGIINGCGAIDTLQLEGALNYAEGVLKVEEDEDLRIGSTLDIDAPLYIAKDIDRNGHISIDGNLNITDSLTFSLSSADFPAGAYRLISFTGSLNDGALKHIGTRGMTGKAHRYEARDNALWIVIYDTRMPAQDVTWTGEASDQWDYSDNNWSIQGVTTTFVADDAVRFGDMAKRFDIAIPSMMPVNGITVEASHDYAFNGNGGFTGSGTLIKDGGGTLTLNNTASDYTGATIIRKGTVMLKALSMNGSASSIGTGSKTPESWQCGKATMTFNDASMATDRGIMLTDTATFFTPDGYSTTFMGTITGDGTLHKTGKGQITLSADNNSWKSTILDGGTIAQGTYTATIGRPASPLHVTGNATFIQFYTQNMANMPQFSNPIEIDRGKTLDFIGTGRGYFKSQLSGEGTIKLSSEYVRFDNYMTGKDFSGTIRLAKGADRLVQSMDMQKATLYVESGVTPYSAVAGGSKTADYTFSFGNIEGEGSLGSGTWNTGYADSDATFSGAFSGNVRKYGKGKWTLNGSTASTGSLSVYDGCVWANSSIDGSVTVYKGATLQGNGTLHYINVKEGGSIGIIYKSPTLKLPGTLTISGNMVTEKNARITVGAKTYSNGTKCDCYKVEGNVSLDAPHFVITELGSATYDATTELKVIDCSGTITVNGNVTISPATPMEGYEWNTSTIAADGTLRIAKATGIDGVNATGNDATLPVYDVAGRRMGSTQRHSLHIIGNRKYNK